MFQMITASRGLRRQTLLEAVGLKLKGSGAEPACRIPVNTWWLWKIAAPSSSLQIMGKPLRKGLLIHP